jgi:polysaccharide biosynthesis/export protein
MNLTLYAIVKKLKNSFWLFLVGSVLLSSCVPQRKIEYLQNKNQESVYKINYEDHILRPYDELYLQISSVNPESANVFQGGNSSVGSASATGASLMSQVIDKEGYLEVPIIGKVLAKDKTIAELKAYLKELLVNILNQPVIDIKLVNKYFSVLGEAKSPGRFEYSQDKINIFEALSMAGDIGTYGNRKKIQLIRNENNVNKIIEINLLQADILASDYYYLKPGDVLYIKPLKIRVWGVGDSPYTIVLTLISTYAILLNLR